MDLSTCVCEPVFQLIKELPQASESLSSVSVPTNVSGPNPTVDDHRTRFDHHLIFEKSHRTNHAFRADPHVVPNPARSEQFCVASDFIPATDPDTGFDFTKADPTAGAQLWQPEAQRLEPICVTFKNFVSLHAGKMIGDEHVIWFSWPIGFIRRPVTLARFGRREFAHFVEDFNFQSPARSAAGELFNRCGPVLS